MKSIALNMHDQNRYDGDVHYQYERHTRIKRNWYLGSHRKFYNEEFLPYWNNDEQFAWSYTGGSLVQFPHWFGELTRVDQIKDPFRPYDKAINEYNKNYSSLWDNLQLNNSYYIDHHQSHAAYALLHSQFKEADVLAIDGGGSKHNAVFFNKKGITHVLDDLPFGPLWNYCCRCVQLNGLSGPGKLMGIVGYGKYNQTIYDALWIIFETPERPDIKRNPVMNKLNRADVAFTLQQFILDRVKEQIVPLKTSDNLCLTGGVVYNGYLNEFLQQFWPNVHIPPAVGDEGQALGNYMHAEYVLNNHRHIPETYCGPRYDLSDNEIDYYEIAQEIASGKIIGWFQGRSESGNRALGNRSILADPRNPNIKDTINSKIKLREDWRPFAPSVLEEHYQDYFDTRTPSPYMSRIVPVISDEIPGVTHVDKTARIQTVNTNQNEKFYKLISAFYEITGVPMLLNTSFNCQEPIVETPEDAHATFRKCGLDTLVIGSDVFRK